MSYNLPLFSRSCQCHFPRKILEGMGIFGPKKKKVLALGLFQLPSQPANPQGHLILSNLSFFSKFLSIAVFLFYWSVPQTSFLSQISSYLALCSTANGTTRGFSKARIFFPKGISLFYFTSVFQGIIKSKVEAYWNQFQGNINCYMAERVIQ